MQYRFFFTANEPFALRMEFSFSVPSLQTKSTSRRALTHPAISLGHIALSMASNSSSAVTNVAMVSLNGTGNVSAANLNITASLLPTVPLSTSPSTSSGVAGTATSVWMGTAHYYNATTATALGVTTTSAGAGTLIPGVVVSRGGPTSAVITVGLVVAALWSVCFVYTFYSLIRTATAEGYLPISVRPARLTAIAAMLLWAACVPFFETWWLGNSVTPSSTSQTISMVLMEGLCRPVLVVAVRALFCSRGSNAVRHLGGVLAGGSVTPWWALQPPRSTISRGADMAADHPEDEPLDGNGRDLTTAVPHSTPSGAGRHAARGVVAAQGFRGSSINRRAAEGVSGGLPLDDGGGAEADLGLQPSSGAMQLVEHCVVDRRRAQAAMRRGDAVQEDVSPRKRFDGDDDEEDDDITAAALAEGNGGGIPSPLASFAKGEDGAPRRRRHTLKPTADAEAPSGGRPSRTPRGESRSLQVMRRCLAHLLRRSAGRFTLEGIDATTQPPAAGGVVAVSGSVAVVAPYVDRRLMAAICSRRAATHVRRWLWTWLWLPLAAFVVLVALAFVETSVLVGLDNANGETPMCGSATASNFAACSLRATDTSGTVTRVLPAKSFATVRFVAQAAFTVSFSIVARRAAIDTLAAHRPSQRWFVATCSVMLIAMACSTVLRLVMLFESARNNICSYIFLASWVEIADAVTLMLGVWRVAQVPSVHALRKVLPNRFMSLMDSDT